MNGFCYWLDFHSLIWKQDERRYLINFCLNVSLEKLIKSYFDLLVIQDTLRNISVCSAFWSQIGALPQYNFVSASICILSTNTVWRERHFYLVFFFFPLCFHRNGLVDWPDFVLFSACWLQHCGLAYLWALSLCREKMSPSKVCLGRYKWGTLSLVFFEATTPVYIFLQHWQMFSLPGWRTA